MSSDIKVTLYEGPSSWFQEEIASSKPQNFLDLIYKQDEDRKKIRIVNELEEDTNEDILERPTNVFIETGDYASLNEHVITNFDAVLRSINPQEIMIHNAPFRVREQLERSLRLTEEPQRYEYPRIDASILGNFHARFEEHLVGQTHVRDSMLAALYPLTRAKSTKPVVVMLYGPSGVGKTETAEFINGLLGGKLMRKQFSMFHNESFSSYLFGGKHSEASFAHDLLDRESGVILIDEFDKANPVFHSAFYQLFDGGSFEDRNYKVNIGPSLIICTSNYGSEDEIRNSIGDPLFSRFDSLIRFEQLSKEEMITVANRLLDRRLDGLEKEEIELLDVGFLRSQLSLFANNPGNVRRVGKVINEAVSSLLVQSLLK